MWQASCVLLSLSSLTLLILTNLILKTFSIILHTWVLFIFLYNCDSNCALFLCSKRRWSIIGHRFTYDSICSIHLNKVQARPEWGLVEWGVHTPDSHGTSRWLRSWPSMAIQSAAIIQGGPTSSNQQVVSIIMRSLSKTNVSCVYQLRCCVALLWVEKYENFWVMLTIWGIALDCKWKWSKQVNLEMIENTWEPSNKDKFLP